MATDYAVTMRGVFVTRSGWPVLQDINWDLRFGEIHALVGEHRSGKSTLAGLISGEAVKSGGELMIENSRVESLSPRQARGMGISVIGQESRLISCMTVAENILLGCRSFLPMSSRAMAEAASRSLNRLGISAPPLARLRDLPPSLQRQVELAKAIVDSPRIFILDEPSQRFTPEEMEILFTHLKEERAKGHCALFISPTLDEALEIADRVTFISAGNIVGTEEREKLDRFRILNLTVPSLASRENLRQANIELYNYKRYNENLIRNLPLGVVIIDTENNINLINESASSILHVDSRSVLGQPADAAGVAHEINNPLCVIRNYVELLKRQPDSKEVPVRLAKIGVELDWIVEIVGGMLSFAKPGDAPREKLDLETVFNDALLLLGHKFKESGITVTSECDPSPLPVIGNENRLKQLLVNLLANAVDAAGEGGLITASASHCQSGGYIEVVISDNGPGIHEQVRDEIFTPFFTTKTSRHNTGLGLSICQQIVEAHNGILLVDRKNGWTHFSLRFPVCGDSCTEI